MPGFIGFPFLLLNCESMALHSLNFDELTPTPLKSFTSSLKLVGLILRKETLSVSQLLPLQLYSVPQQLVRGVHVAACAAVCSSLQSAILSIRTALGLMLAILSPPVIQKLDKPIHWGRIRISEARPQVGDIVCQWRGTNETTFDEAETQSRFENHTDIIIAVRKHAIVTLGGNVANASSQGLGVTVKTKTFSLDANGYLPGTRRVVALMKNRHRPFSDQGVFVGA